MRLDKDMEKLINRHTKCTCWNDFLLVCRVVLVVYTMHSLWICLTCRWPRYAPVLSVRRFLRHIYTQNGALSRPTPPGFSYVNNYFKSAFSLSNGPSSMTGNVNIFNLHLTLKTFLILSLYTYVKNSSSTIPPVRGRTARVTISQLCNKRVSLLSAAMLICCILCISSPPPPLASKRPALQKKHCKKDYWFFRLQPECHLPNSPWPGIIKLFPARGSLVSDISARDGKTANLFYSVDRLKRVERKVVVMHVLANGRRPLLRHQNTAWLSVHVILFYVSRWWRSPASTWTPVRSTGRARCRRNTAVRCAPARADATRTRPHSAHTFRKTHSRLRPANPSSTLYPVREGGHSFAWVAHLWFFSFFSFFFRGMGC